MLPGLSGKALGESSDGPPGVAQIATGDPSLTLYELISTLVQSPIDAVRSACCLHTARSSHPYGRCSDAACGLTLRTQYVSPTS